MKITINFDKTEESDLMKASKDIDLESFCKVSIMIRVAEENFKDLSK